MEVTCTDTEELVTRIKATFRWDYAYGDEATVIVKSNDLMYGIRQQDDDDYVYTHTESMMKSVTFWLIRKSNTWKKLKFRTFLQALALGTYDTVELQFGEPWVCKDQVNAMVESCSYDSADNTVEVVCWVPVVFGSSVQHPLAWSRGRRPTSRTRRRGRDRSRGRRSTPATSRGCCTTSWGWTRGRSSTPRSTPGTGR